MKKLKTLSERRKKSMADLELSLNNQSLAKTCKARLGESSSGRTLDDILKSKNESVLDQFFEIE
jgi:hypothetical protein